MAKVVVLGGCGTVGSVAVKTLARQDTFSEVLIADINLKRSQELAASIGKKVSAVRFDADDSSSIRAAVKGADIVLNCVGPFYKTVKQILSVVIEERINYIDVCDDVDVTLEILDWDKKAKDAGILALIGMGSSPGATNLIGKFGSQMLDETDSIDIFHVHGGEPFEGEGVIGHRFHCMTIDCPMFLDGELKYVKYFEPSGIALRQSYDFPILGEIPLYPYPHPEGVLGTPYLIIRSVARGGGSYRDLQKFLLLHQPPLHRFGKRLR